MNILPQSDITREAQGHWPRILISLGLPPGALRNKHQPCPACGGRDRFRFDNKDGRGSYYCNQCGAGDGFSLAMKYHGWDFKRCADEVRQVLGTQHTANLQTPPKAYIPAMPDKSPTRDYALTLWRGCSHAESYDAAVASHPYAIKKRITHAAGARRGVASGRLIGRDADCLLIPQRTLQGELVGVECINPEGIKQTFGNKGILILGNDLDVTIPMLVLEGWASAVKWLDSRKWNACAVASFGKGSADKTALALQAHYQNHFVLVGVEHD